MAGRNLLTYFFSMVLATLSVSSFAAHPAAAIIGTEPITRDFALVRDGKEGPKTNRLFEAVVLENKYLKLLVCPELGERIVGLVDKITGRQLLYEGVIRCSGSVLDEGGGSGGGIQINHPFYHAGSSYVVTPLYKTAVLGDGTAEIVMSVTHYPHLQRTVWRIRLPADEAAFYCDYRFENLAPYAMGFNPWICAAFPIAEDVRFVLPTHWTADHWFGINPPDAEGGRYFRVESWPVAADGRNRSIMSRENKLIAFAVGVEDGHAGLYRSARDDGIVRVFDPRQMPGLKASGWWNPEGKPSWCELWAAFSQNMEDPLWIGPFDVVTGSDKWIPFHGIGGLTRASENGVLCLEASGESVVVGAILSRVFQNCSVVLSYDGQLLFQWHGDIGPSRPFSRRVRLPAGADALKLVLRDSDGNILMEDSRYLSPRPQMSVTLPDQPWHRRTVVARAKWEEAFTPLMAWGPWYDPLKTYAEAEAMAPHDAAALVGRARSLYKDAVLNLFRRKNRPVQKEALEEALRILRDLTAKDSAAFSEVVMLRGLIELKLGMIEQSRRSWMSAAGTDADSGVIRYSLALLSAFEGDWEGAVSSCRQAVWLSPAATLPRLLLGCALFKRNQQGVAEEVLESALNSDPNELAALEFLRRIAEQKGDVQKAMAIGREISCYAERAKQQFHAAMATVVGLESGVGLTGLESDTVKVGTVLTGLEAEEAQDDR